MVTTTRSTATVRIGRNAHERLRAIAAQTGEQIGEALDRAIEREECRLVWQQFHESVERLRSDPAACSAYRAEGKELEQRTSPLMSYASAVFMSVTSIRRNDRATSASRY